MGEVYRARDTKLGRSVALKTIPDSFANDGERLARFEREARTLATLNHPHIAQIYGLEESQGTRALVMELVDGEDLSQRLARGPIPVREAMRIAGQIAEAIEAAHEQESSTATKPANIKVTGRPREAGFDWRRASKGHPGSATDSDGLASPDHQSGDDPGRMILAPRYEPKRTPPTSAATCGRLGACSRDADR
jgi:serine/threonine protein kinase